VSATDLEVMRRLDRLHLEFPFAGSRMLRVDTATADAQDLRLLCDRQIVRMGS
jgi:hypothetical protein